MCQKCQRSREELLIATQEYSRESRLNEPHLSTTPLENQEISFLDEGSYKQMIKYQLAQKRQYEALRNWNESRSRHD